MWVRRPSTVVFGAGKPQLIPQGTILAYHAVGACLPEDDPNYLYLSESLFRTQMECLARTRMVVPLDVLVEGSAPSGHPAVAITFDDAYRCILTIAAPVLAGYGFPATVFLPTAYVGGGNVWDPPSDGDFSIMDADELGLLRELGFAIESHGHAHIDLGRSSEPEIRADLETSRSEIVKLTGRAPRYLAYPYGSMSPAACRVAAEMSFEAAFSINLPHSGRYEWARVPVTRLDGAHIFRAKTTGDYLRLRYSRYGRLATRIVRVARTVVPSGR
jgi:peptidoglycan/xylan/chitin deacetylase (PgdA/CDA1 family)